MIPLNSMTSVIAHDVIDFFDNRDFNNTCFMSYDDTSDFSRDTCDFS